MTRIAWISVRNAVHYRRDAFAAGMKRLGYEPRFTLPLGPLTAHDALLVWNRYGPVDRVAKVFEQRGLPVIVAENGYLGNELPARPGERFYALALNHHNGAGRWPVGGPERWDSLGIELRPWRTEGSEVVVLPQRGIGPPGVAMPLNWLRTGQKLGRVRRHPGQKETIALEADLKRARAVVTWGSGAALKALAWGIPAFHGMPRWIGSQAARRIEFMDQGPVRDDARRLDMFRALSWAQASLDEIASGDALARLLELHRS